MLELGTYCGYSAIFLVKTLLEECLQRQQQQARSDKDTGMTTTTVFRLTTVDVVEQHVKIAREMIRLAGVESYIDLVLLTQEDDDDDDDDHNHTNNNHLSLSSHPSVKDHYEFVFLDHDKSLYLSDLQALERTHRIRRGTYVAADNVIFAQIDEYRQYLQRLASHQVVTTRLEEGYLEYSSPERQHRIMDGTPQSNDAAQLLKDGIELSIYLKDPVLVDLH
ncbi:methyltransferase domain containing protein [Nitzschia inconspicua]|uniref:catechol O-methyltransferase n=1 Tax=Nitzschia inconspicua TaxID=303405 RepID=A0A9K3L8Q8_9STRA|nr:methyltransferase domain containing protein [Nitzschia inconspicua]